MRHTVVFEQTPNNRAAYVPDLPGCVATADTRVETRSLIQEAIALDLKLLREHGDTIPVSGTWTEEVEVDSPTGRSMRSA